MICNFTETQIISTAVIVDVEATTAVEVFYSIFPNTVSDVTYTVSTMIHVKLIF